MAVQFNPDIVDKIAVLLLGMPDVERRKMFGYPAWYFCGKMIACVYENGVGLKQQETRVLELTGKPGYTFFQPLGRARMKEWVYITHDNPQDFQDDAGLLEEALRFAAAAQPAGR